MTPANGRVAHLSLRGQIDAENFVDLVFDFLVGHHFAADFGEAGDAAFDEEEADFIHVADVAGAEPAVLDDAVGFSGGWSVAGSVMRTALPAAVMTAFLTRTACEFLTS